MTEEELIALADEGQRAEVALRYFQTAFLKVKARLLDEFESTGAFDSKKRDEVWRQLNSLNVVVAELQEAAELGQEAQDRLSDRHIDTFIG